MKGGVILELEISAKLSRLKVNTGEKSNNTLNITNVGNTPVKFMPSNCKSEAGVFHGIKLAIPYGDGSYDLTSEKDITKVVITSNTKNIEVRMVKNYIPEKPGEVVWDIYPVKEVIFEPNDSIVIKLNSVKINNSPGKAKISMCIYNDDYSHPFFTELEKLSSAKNVDFSVMLSPISVNEFISLEMLENDMNKCFMQKAYDAPPDPPVPPYPPVHKKKFLVKWDCKNSSFCQLSYGKESEKVDSSGEKSIDIDNNIKTITVTAHLK